MTTIYICRSMEDIAAFIRMFPKACWRNGSLLSVSSDSKLHASLPIALRKQPDTNTISWSTVYIAEYHLQSRPSNYTLGELHPLLDLATVFITFLKHHNAYEKFITQDFQCTVDIQLSELLMDTFGWDDSFEGYEYWDNLDDKWRHLIRNFKLNPNEVIPNLLDILHTTITH